MWKKIHTVFFSHLETVYQIEYSELTRDVIPNIQENEFKCVRNVKMVTGEVLQYSSLSGS